MTTATQEAHSMLSTLIIQGYELLEDKEKIPQENEN